MQSELNQPPLAAASADRPASQAVAAPARLAALAQSGILDTAPEPDFDDLVRLATRLCAVPIALVSFVAADRQWFKARINFSPGETDLDRSVCKFVLTEPDLLVIPDLTLDPRTAGNPLVAGAPGIRFYAGAPLRTADGEVVGSLCVIDTVPRPDGLTADQADDLRALAGQVMALVALRRAVAERIAIETALRESHTRGRLAADATGIGIFDYDVAGEVLEWDLRVRKLFGVAEDAPVTYADTFLPGVHPDDRAEADAAVRAALDPSGPGTFDIEYRVVPLDGGAERWLAARGQAVVEGGRAVRFVGTVLDVTTRRHAEDLLRGTEERYRLAGRATNDAVWDWDFASDHVLWNDALNEAYGHAPEAVEPTGDWWIAHIHPGDRVRVADSIHAVIDGAGTAWSDEYRFLRADGSYADVVDRGYVIRDAAGRAQRMIGAMLDITGRKAAEVRNAALVALGDRLRAAASAAEVVGAAAEILGQTLAASRAGYARIDLGKDLFEVDRDWVAPGGTSLKGRYGLSTFSATIARPQPPDVAVISDVEAGDRRDGGGATGARAQINVPVVDRGELVGLLFAHQDEARDWAAEEVEFARGVADRTHAALGKLTAEADQKVLNEELSHRLKNTLAMVLSIAKQTLRSVPDRAPVAAFEQRIHALSSAHDVLLRQAWTAAPIADVVHAVMSGAGHAERIDAAGPDVPLGPRATLSLSLSLLLHELVTNAVKYGSLSTPAGRVAVRWRLEGAGDEAEVELDWREHGGPPPVAPPPDGGKGFGSRLIRMGLAGTGGVELSYPTSGFRATMRAPLIQLQRS